jgi:Flp pilus assembly protein TadB
VGSLGLYARGAHRQVPRLSSWVRRKGQQMLPLSDYERRVLSEIESDFAGEACRRRYRRRLITWGLPSALCVGAATLIVLASVQRLPVVVSATFAIVGGALLAVVAAWARRSRRRDVFAAVACTRRHSGWRHGPR